MWLLRVLLFASLFATMMGALIQGEWKALYRFGRRTWSTHLSESPVWRPPAHPSYDEFLEIFNDLPKVRHNGSVIRRELMLERMTLKTLFRVWGITTLIAVLYWALGVRRRIRDPVLILSSGIAAGLTIAAAGCIAVWIIAGGWGPPVPVGLTGTCGIVLGTCIGISTIRLTREDNSNN